jgi:hypothetical protein
VNYSQVVAHDGVNMTVVADSKIGSAVSLRGTTRLDMESSSGFIIYGLDASQISLTNSNVSMLGVKDSVKVLAKDSIVEEFLLTAFNVTGSWVGLTNFFENFSLVPVGYGPTVSVFNTAVKGLDLLFLGNSDMSIYNSTIRNLSLQGSSIVRLYNVSIVSNFLSIKGDSKVYFWSPLRVRLVDYFGSPLSGVNVTALLGYGYTGEQLAKATTGPDGWANFVLFSEFVNASGSFPFGYISLLCRSANVTSYQSATLARLNKEVIVSMPLPSWSMYILPSVIVVVIIVILAVISLVYSRIRRRSS